MIPGTFDRFKYGRRVALLTVCLLLCVSNALADVGPPVEIKMPPGSRRAMNGRVYEGEFVIRIYDSGVLDNVELSGEGWNVIKVDLPKPALTVQPGELRIPFRAVPRNANQPLELTFTFDGRRVRQAYEIGPIAKKRAGTKHSLRSVELKGAVGNAANVAAANDESESSARAQGDPYPLRVTGRIVYDRPGMDNDGDGDFDDPGDVVPGFVGVDHVWVRVLDNDPVGSETIWEGATNIDGTFDTGIVQWDDCDISGCDDPDLIIEVELDTSVVDVTNNDITEDTYTFETPEVLDFGGSLYEFGALTPSNNGMMPALHIFNSIVRTERFIRTKTPYNPPKVQVEWPDDSRNGGAWYESGSVEIHLSTERQWRTDTQAHEFGHHFMHSFMITIPPDYCNGVCDGGWQDACAAGPDPCESGGHCLWCEETDHDAWNEGWPDWLADVVPRSYPLEYQNDDGSAFLALFTRDMEDVRGCGCDGGGANAFKIEGMVGAFLTDIEDGTQDDKGADCPLIRCTQAGRSGQEVVEADQFQARSSQ